MHFEDGGENPTAVLSVAWIQTFQREMDSISDQETAEKCMRLVGVSIEMQSCMRNWMKSKGKKGRP